MRHDVSEAVGHNADVGVAGAVWSLIENREDEGRIGSPGKSTGADGKVRIERVDGLDGSGAGQHVEHAIDNPALEEPARKVLSDSQRLVQPAVSCR